MLPAQRRGLILDAVRSGQGVEVVDLAQRFAVSEMTVRRDLARLAREGKLTRVHGGAVSEREEPPFAEISVERLDEKRADRSRRCRARRGRTVGDDRHRHDDAALARWLHGRKLTVITSNLAVIEELMPDPRIELIVLGGVVRRNYRSLVGMLAEDALRQLSADIAFLGASGIREDLSVMDTTMVEVPIKRGMIAASRRAAVLLATRAKFEMTGSVRVCGADELDVVVTDATRGAPGVAALGRGRRRGGARMKIAILGGGGFRVPLVYGALLARARTARARARRRSTTSTSARLAQIAPVLEGLERERGAQLAFRGDDRPRRRARRRRLRLLRDPRRQARGPRRRRARPARRGSRRPGDDRAGRAVLRAADRSGDGRARASASPSARRRPGSSTSRIRRGSSPRRSAPSSATARSGSATRRRDSAGASRPRSTAIRRSSGSTTSASTTSAGCAAVYDGDARPAAGPARATTSASRRSRRAVSSAASGCARSG